MPSRGIIIVKNAAIILLRSWKLRANIWVKFIALCAAVLPEYFFYIAAFLFLIILFSSFCVRMETIYFAVDRLDREDIIRSWRDL